MTASAQLAAIVSGLNAASEEVRELQRRLSDDAWLRAPGTGRWSAAECIEHLNITSRSFVVLLGDALAEARKLPAKSSSSYLLDIPGWLLVKSLASRSSFSKSKTAKGFVPVPLANLSVGLEEFYRLQGELIRLASESQGLAIDKVKIRSPFNSKIKYNAYSAFRILVVHEQRHIGQAREAAGAA